MNREPGTFSNHANGVKYIALSRAARAVGIPAHEITAAVSQSRLTVVEVSGCKCLTLADLVAFVRGGK
jgi:hypothetical protein